MVVLQKRKKHSSRKVRTHRRKTCRRKTKCNKKKFPPNETRRQRNNKQKVRFYRGGGFIPPYMSDIPINKTTCADVPLLDVKSIRDDAIYSALN